MDWSRAKTVLIWAFFFLNILLGYQLWMDELNLTTLAENATRREEMNRLFSLKDVRLDTAVPEGMPVLSELAVSLRSPEAARKPAPLSVPLPRNRLGESVLLREALAADVPQLDQYEPDPNAIKQGDLVFVMNQLQDGLPMFEMRLELYGEGDMVDRYRYVYAEREESAGGETAQGQEVLSAYVVLAALAEHYLPQGAVVSDVRLGYHGPIFESETQVLAPYWRVVLSTKETYYVHAISGAVEGPLPVAENGGSTK